MLVCLTFSGCSQPASTSTVLAANHATNPATILPVRVSSKWGYMNSSGQLVINPQFDYADDFHEGRARVCLGASCWEPSNDAPLSGFIDISGKMVVTPQYWEADVFSEGLADVCTKSEGTQSEAESSLEQFQRLERQTTPSSCGYIDRDGKVAIPMQFGRAERFSEGLAKVCVGKCDYKSYDSGYGGKFGFIDHSGHFVVNPQYDYVGDFKNGFAKVEVGNGVNAKTGYIDKTGKTVWQPSN
jgi:hypothetical protein